jgi:hypothetical protein
MICINRHNILLGSDLEYSIDPRKGWLCILNNCQSIRSKMASLYKIPHHGSENGYNQRIWSQLVLPTATANLTPWNKGKQLPQMDMLEIFLMHTSKLYMTSMNKKNNSPKNRERSLAKTIKRFNSSLNEVKYRHGTVRCRINALTCDNEWQVDLYGDAVKISNDILTK